MSSRPAVRVKELVRDRKATAARSARRQLIWRTAVMLVGVAAARAFWLVAVALPDFARRPAAAVNSSVVGRNLVTRRTTAESILDEHGRYFHTTSIKMTTGTAIAMLTGKSSWRESFQLAYRNAAKFSHIAPSWYRVAADGSSVVASEHLLLRAMAASLLRRPPTRMLTPVVAFGDIDPRRVVLDGDDPQPARELARRIAQRCSWGCDGLLLDAPYALRAHGPRARPFIAALVTELSSRLRASRRQLLLVVPALETEAFSREDVAKLDSYVDVFIVRTFGFSPFSRPGPDAPLPWMMHGLQGLLPSAGSESLGGQKLVPAVRFGGHDFELPHGGRALCGAPYIELLRAQKPRFDWYAEASEHVFTYTDERNVTHSVYHPTLKSLHDRLTAIRSWGVGLAVDELHCGLDYFFDLL